MSKDDNLPIIEPENVQRLVVGQPEAKAKETAADENPARSLLDSIERLILITDKGRRELAIVLPETLPPERFSSLQVTIIPERQPTGAEYTVDEKQMRVYVNYHKLPLAPLSSWDRAVSKRKVDGGIIATNVTTIRLHLDGEHRVFCYSTRDHFYYPENQAKTA